MASHQLAKYVSKNRVVLVFAPSAEDARLNRQQSLFGEHQSELAERDIVVLSIVGPEDRRLRNQFRVGQVDFATILIGKDGTEKHRWNDVAPVDQINYRIDRMPMRRVEMRSKEISRSAP